MSKRKKTFGNSSIHQSLPRTLKDGIATYDLARLLPGSREVACSEFGQALIDHI
jgi:isocitrate dehydrogenase